ncbi:MAG: PAS domain S-box protein [Luteolibacter sp.]
MLFENNPQPMWVFDRQSLRFLAVNQAAIDHYGYSRDEFLSMTIADIRRSEEVSALLETVASATPGVNCVGEANHLLKDGRTISVEITSFPLEYGGREARMVIAQDITERRRSLDVLAQNEREQRELVRMLEIERGRLVTAQSVAKVGNWETNLDTMEVIWSDEIYRICEVTRHDIQPCHQAFLDLVHPDDRKRVDDAFVESIKTLSPSLIGHRLLLGGRTKHVEERWQVFVDGAGRPLRAMGTCQDITERKKAEQERDRLFDLSGDLLCIASFDGMLEQVNPAWTHCLGWSAEELTGRPSLDFVHPDDREPTLRARAELIQGAAIKIENRYLCKDGSSRWLSWSTHSLPETRQVFGVARDVTAAKLAELELARSNRALRMLSSCCESLTRISDERQLITDICQLAVEIGGYRMAWVGYAADDEDRSIIPMAQAGDEHGYLSKIKLTWSENDEISRGPAGRTIQSGKAVVCEDITRESEFFHWQEDAWESGYGSVICLPLSDEGRTFGLLALYSGGINEAGNGELKLLQELADDLAFGIVNIRSQNEHRRMQAAVMKVASSVSASANEQFLVQLAANMSEALGAQAGIIARFLPGLPATARTVAAVVDGRAAENFDYMLEGTPCEGLTNSDVCIVECGVTESFPKLASAKLSGSEAYVGRRLVDSNGQPVGLLFVAFRDALKNTDFITSTLQIFATRAAAELERQKAEVLLREQASLLGKAQDAIFVCDLENRVLYWNLSAQRVYGWTEEEALGKSVKNLIYREPADYLAAQRSTAENGEWVGEIGQVTKSGQRLIVEGHWSLVHDDQGSPKSILAINTDITERKQLEQQFLRAQRMESIGTLAGGIAHDLNNVLAPIMMSIGLLGKYISHPKGLEILDLVGTSARRGADMVGQVLSFARGVEGQSVQVDLTLVVRDLARIIDETFPKNIRFEIDCADDLWLVMGDPTRLHQVLLNLCVNARDAMPEGGLIRLKVENLMIDDHVASMNLDACPGPYLKIELEDSGHGIPAEIIDKLFDPFFTTKGVGEGTGLGLSTSLAIVKGYGGFIRICSEPGTGARFHIYLPAITCGSEELIEPEWNLPRGHDETVLVVDDEEPIRRITRQILEAFGYKVILACDGVEAVAIYSAQKDHIDVVLTDMMMPVMDGPATIGALLEINPQVRIIAASGLSANGRLVQAAQDGVRHYLPKPYTAEILLNLLRLVMSEETNGSRSLP